MPTDSFGVRLRTARENYVYNGRRGLTRQQFADLVGCKIYTVKDYESRSEPPSTSDYIVAMEHVLGVRLRPSDAATPLDDVNPAVSDASPSLLLRSLSAKVDAAQRARTAVLPLVSRLAHGEWATEAERDRWVRVIEEALSDAPSDRPFSVAGIPPEGEQATDGDGRDKPGGTVQA